MRDEVQSLTGLIVCLAWVRSMSEKKCRWGILGAAGIAMKNWQSIALSGNGEIVAVASRDKAKAEALIEKCSSRRPFPKRPEAIEGYDALLARSDIDAVYIPLPTGFRKEWAIKAAQAGKHILCEKPCGVEVADVEAMLAACDAAGVQFMDGVMFMHSGRLDALRTAIDDGTSIGTLRRINTQFSFCGGEEFAQDNIRMHSELEPLGCLGDLGWYCVTFSLWAMKHKLPNFVIGRMLNGAARPDSPDQVPLEFSADLLYEGGVSASFYCSFNTGLQQWASLSGPKGCIQLDDFVLPCYGSEVAFTVTEMNLVPDVSDFTLEKRAQRVVTPEYGSSHPTAQESKLFRKFSDLVLQGTVDRSWGENSLKVQRVVAACMKSAQNDGSPVAL